MTCTSHTQLTATCAKVNGLLMAKGRASVKAGSPRLAKILALHYMRRGAWVSENAHTIHILLYREN